VSGRFAIIESPMEGVVLLARTIHSDQRGFLSRLFDAEDLLELGWSGAVAQVNHTLTRQKGTIRGMHFQMPPFTETKLVTCLSGMIHDVVVDVRQGSPTFLHHKALTLDSDRAQSLLIGPGFAHGFQSLSDDAVLIYAHSAPFRTDAERGLDPMDPALHISWPLEVTAISDRDKSHPAITPEFVGVLP